MVFRFTPSCNCCCDVFSDAFTRSDDTDIGASWDEVEPGAAIVSNRLRMNTAGCLVVTTATSPGTSFYLTTKWESATSNIDFRAIVDYVDDDNYHFLNINFRHTGATSTIQLFQRVAGTETAISAAVDSDGFDANTEYGLELCLSAEGKLVGSLTWIGVGLVISCSAEATALSGTKTGLMLVDAGTIYWDDFDWQNHGDSCPVCQLHCSLCANGTSPLELQLTIAGVVDDTCTECEQVNATWVLEQTCPCEWRLELPFATDVCSVAAADRTETCSDFQDYTYRAPFLRVNVDLAFGDLTATITYFGIGGNTWTAAAVIAGWDGVCDWEFDYAPADVSSLVSCDFTSFSANLQVAP